MDDPVPIWFEYPAILISEPCILQFYPDINMTYNQKLNAIMRFGLYFSIILYLIRRDTRVFLLAAAIAGFTWAFHKNAREAYTPPQFLPTNQTKLPYATDAERKTCPGSEPTKNNPFMNVLMNEYAQNPKRHSACYANHKEIKPLIKGYFDEDLPRDSDDIFDKNASDRQWYTNPSTTIPNDQKTFAEWLYKVPRKTNKERYLCGGYSLGDTPSGDSAKLTSPKGEFAKLTSPKGEFAKLMTPSGEFPRGTT